MPADPEPGYDDTEPLAGSLGGELGLPTPQFRDETIAPKVDRELLTRMARRELPDTTVRAVYRLIHSFQSWNDAYAEIVAVEFRRQQGLG